MVIIPSSVSTWVLTGSLVEPPAVLVTLVTIKSTVSSPSTKASSIAVNAKGNTKPDGAKTVVSSRVNVLSTKLKSLPTTAVPVVASSTVKATVAPGAIVAELSKVTPPSEEVSTRILPMTEPPSSILLGAGLMLILTTSLSTML